MLRTLQEGDIIYQISSITALDGAEPPPPTYTAPLHVAALRASFQVDCKCCKSFKQNQAHVRNRCGSYNFVQDWQKKCAISYQTAMHVRGHGGVEKNSFTVWQSSIKSLNFRGKRKTSIRSMDKFLQKITKGLTVTDVVFTNDKIQFHLNDGRYIACPLAWFPYMENADKTQRAYFEADDFTIAFPEIDEYFSIRGLFYYSHTHEADINEAKKSKDLQEFITILTAPLAITGTVLEDEKIIVHINDGREFAFPAQWLGNLPAHTHFQVAPDGKSVTWNNDKQQFDLSFLFLPSKQVV